MYTKKIKRGKKLYSYYYHNVKHEGRVKNIFLGSNKEEALVKLNKLKDEHAHNILLNNAPSPITKEYKLINLIIILFIFSSGILVFYLIGNITGLYVISGPTPSFASFINTTDVTTNNTNVNLSVNWLSISVTGTSNITATWYENNKSLLFLNMPFDTNTTEVFDYSDFGNNGTIINLNTNVTWNITGCKLNGCYNFNGFNSLINITLSTRNFGLTQELWVRNNTDNVFRHLVNSSGQLYADGVQVNNASHRLPISNKTNSIRIGIFDNEQYFNGTIDEVRIWNKTLSANQIYQNYLDGIANTSIKTFVDAETTRLRTYKAQLAVANSSNLGNFTNTSEVLILNTIPSAPLINLPANSTYFNQSSLTFDVNGSDDIDNDQIYYSLELSSDVNFNTVNFYNGTLIKLSNISNQYNLSTSLTDSSYYFRVKATDLLSNSSYSETRLLTIDTLIPSN